MIWYAEYVWIFMNIQFRNGWMYSTFLHRTNMSLIVNWSARSRWPLMSIFSSFVTEFSQTMVRILSFFICISFFVSPTITKGLKRTFRVSIQPNFQKPLSKCYALTSTSHILLQAIWWRAQETRLLVHLLFMFAELSGIIFFCFTLHTVKSVETDNLKRETQ